MDVVYVEDNLGWLVVGWLVAAALLVLVIAGCVRRNGPAARASRSASGGRAAGTPAQIS